MVAGAVRYRFYVAEGLTLPEVAQVQVLFGLTYSLGFATLCGLALVAEPQVLSPISAVPPWIWRALGLTLIAFVLGYLAWAAAHKGPVRLFGHELPRSVLSSRSRRLCSRRSICLRQRRPSMCCCRPEPAFPMFA